MPCEAAVSGGPSIDAHKADRAAAAPWARTHCMREEEESSGGARLAASATAVLAAAARAALTFDFSAPDLAAPEPGLAAAPGEPDPPLAGSAPDSSGYSGNQFWLGESAGSGAAAALIEERKGGSRPIRLYCVS